MRRSLLLAAAAVSAASWSLRAQTLGVTHRYTVLGLRGDTIATQQSVRDSGGISGQVLGIGGSRFSYHMTTGSAGRVIRTCLVERTQAGGVREVVAELRPPHVRVKLTEGTQEQSVIAEIAGPTALYVPGIISSLEQLIRGVQLRVGDSARVLMANFRHGDTATRVISRISEDSIRVRDPNADIRVRVSDRREILGGTSIPHPLASGLSGLINPRMRFLLVREPDVAGDATSAQFSTLSCVAPGSRR